MTSDVACLKLVAAVCARRDIVTKRCCPRAARPSNNALDVGLKPLQGLRIVASFFLRDPLWGFGRRWGAGLLPSENPSFGVEGRSILTPHRIKLAGRCVCPTYRETPTPRVQLPEYGGSSPQTHYRRRLGMQERLDNWVNCTLC